VARQGHGDDEKPRPGQDRAHGRAGQGCGELDPCCSVTGTGADRGPWVLGRVGEASQGQ